MKSFSHENGILFCENVSIAEIAEKFGSPVYVYSENHIRSKARDYLTSLSKPGMICFSVKALVIGVILGHWMNSKLSDKSFFAIINFFIVVASLRLIYLGIVDL